MRKFAKMILYALRMFLPRKKGALILAYHSIDSHDDQYTVTPEMFEWQLSEIEHQGLRVISMQDLERMIDSGHVEDGTLVLTFDDARRDNYKNLFPIINAKKIPVTIFSITSLIGKEYVGKARAVPIMTAEQMREMHDAGCVDFEPHTETHQKLPNMSADLVRHEIQKSKQMLESFLGKTCRYFAYPYGRFNLEVQKIVREARIRLAVAAYAGFVTADTDRLALPRNDIRHDVTRAQFKSILKRGALR